jgi:uncharacterized RDD family membrane protein YckC
MTAHATGPADDVIVTGEAVALEVRAASVLTRVLAAALDIVLYAAIGIGASMLIAAVPPSDEAALAAVAIATIAAVTVVIPTTVETVTRGRSLGKLAAGLAIVRDDGGPVRFRQAFTRALLGIGELWLTAGGIALVVAILHPKGKRLGDIAAGTYCVRVRTTPQVGPPLTMPPELARWAGTADIRALPDGVALTARRFLARAATLNPRSRETLGRSLAARIEPLVSPPPPWGTAPERFLAAVLVVRRDREYAIGVARRDRVAAETERVGRLPFGIDGAR